MSQHQFHLYTVLSIRGPVYVPLNFALPSFVLPGEGVCFLTPQDCTLLQKLLRYRSEGPVVLREQQLSGTDLEPLPLLLAESSRQHCPVSLNAAIPAALTWNQQPPMVRCVQIVSALFFSHGACEQTMKDILAVINYQRFSSVPLNIRQERRRPKDSEASCSCMLTSVYKDIAFYTGRETCSRHVQHLTQHPDAPSHASLVLEEKNASSAIDKRTVSSLDMIGPVTPSTSLNPSAIF